MEKTCCKECKLTTDHAFGGGNYQKRARCPGECHKPWHLLENLDFRGNPHPPRTFTCRQTADTEIAAGLIRAPAVLAHSYFS